MTTAPPAPGSTTTEGTAASTGTTRPGAAGPRTAGRGDSQSGEQTARGSGPDRRRVATSPMFVGMIALVSLGAFESLAVSTAMPVIAASLDGLALYAPAFALTIATSVMGMVLAGRSTDRGTVGPSLLGGVGVFVLGLLLAGLAPSMGVLLVGRTLQGLGSGAYIVALYMIVARQYSGAARAKVLAAFSTAWVVPSLVGPLLAGIVVSHLGWRWVFLSVAILAVPAVLMLVSAVRDSARTATTAGDDPAAPPATGPASRRGALWWAAAASAGVALMSLGTENHSAPGYTMIALGAVVVLAVAPRLLPRGTLRAGRGLPTVIALRGLVASSFYAAEVFLPLILQQERGFSPARSGIVLTAGAVTWALGSLMRSRLTWSSAAFLRLGTWLVVVAIAGVALLVVPSVPAELTYVAWAAGGLGLGMVFPTLAILVFDLSPTHEQGSNTSSLQVADALSSAFLLALAGIAIAWLVPSVGGVGYLGAFVLAGLVAVVAAVVAPRATADAPATANATTTMAGATG